MNRYIYYNVICYILYMKHKWQNTKHIIDKLINKWTSRNMNLGIWILISGEMYHITCYCEKILLCKNLDNQMSNDFR